MDRPNRAGARLLAVAAALAFATACGESSPRVFVVGDSTMAQVRAFTGAGAAKSGCGYTAHAECTIPLDTDVAGDPDEAEVIVAAASIWDVGASDPEIAAGYGAYQAALSVHGPVVWVELPPIFGVAPDDPFIAEAAAFNAAVSEALGCELQPWTLREATSGDGVHYDEEGARTVADRFAELGPGDAC